MYSWSSFPFVISFLSIFSALYFFSIFFSLVSFDLHPYDIYISDFNTFLLSFLLFSYHLIFFSYSLFSNPVSFSLCSFSSHLFSLMFLLKIQRYSYIKFTNNFISRKIDNREGLEVNDINQFLVYSDVVALLGDCKDILISNVQYILLNSAKDIGIE